MAKISTTTKIKQGGAEATIDENGRVLIGCIIFNLNDPEEQICQEIEDLLHVIEVLQKHLTDTH